MTDSERRALLDYCTNEFQAHFCFIKSGMVSASPANPNRQPLQPAKRQWASIGFSGFKEDPEEQVYTSKIVGQRSDGQTFFALLPLPFDFTPEGDRKEWLMRKLSNCLSLLEKFRDCSCGIIGHEKTEDKDEDGDFIFRQITSPCETHPDTSYTKALNQTS